jgi:hypothetical protein
MIDQNKLHKWIQEGVVALAIIVEGSLIETEESRSGTVIRSSCCDRVKSCLDCSLELYFKKQFLDCRLKLCIKKQDERAWTGFM